MLDRREWTLLALAAAEGKSLTPVQLQKVMFLIGQQARQFVGPNYYEFRAYNYGPFCQAIYADAEVLQVEGLARLAGNGRWTNYAATEAGIERAGVIAQSIPKDAAAYVEDLVAWARSLTFDQLVRSVYDRFPDMRKNSVWTDPEERAK